MAQQDEQEVLATVSASLGRRILGLASLGLLGVLLIYIAFARPPSVGYQVFLLVIGGGSLWLAERMRQATASRVELTRAGLRDADGTLIAPIEEIESLDRGVFAYKPSNGFLVRTHSRADRAWRPGLWWRIGRRVGVGGMTPGAQSKFMAEMISALLLEREDQEGR